MIEYPSLINISQILPLLVYILLLTMASHNVFSTFLCVSWPNCMKSIFHWKCAKDHAFSVDFTFSWKSVLNLFSMHSKIQQKCFSSQICWKWKSAVIQSCTCSAAFYPQRIHRKIVKSTGNFFSTGKFPLS